MFLNMPENLKIPRIVLFRVTYHSKELILTTTYDIKHSESPTWYNKPWNRNNKYTFGEKIELILT